MSQFFGSRLQLTIRETKRLDCRRISSFVKKIKCNFHEEFQSRRLRMCVSCSTPSQVSWSRVEGSDKVVEKSRTRFGSRKETETHTHPPNPSRLLSLLYRRHHKMSNKCERRIHRRPRRPDGTQTPRVKDRGRGDGNREIKGLKGRLIILQHP